MPRGKAHKKSNGSSPSSHAANMNNRANQLNPQHESYYKSRGYTKFFHGTDDSSARSIARDGFNPSESGLVGPGVYWTQDVDKALSHGDTVLEGMVLPGRVDDVRIEKKRKTSASVGDGDTVHIAHGNGVHHEIFCTKDPARLVVQKVHHY